MLAAGVSVVITSKNSSNQEQEVQSLIKEKDYSVYINGVLIDKERILPDELASNIYEITIDHKNKAVLLQTKEPEQKENNSFIPYYIPIIFP